MFIEKELICLPGITVGIPVSHNATACVIHLLRNQGYEWVIDIDVEQFFDKVNHDKLIQILREQVNNSSVLNLISNA